MKWLTVTLPARPQETRWVGYIHGDNYTGGEAVMLWRGYPRQRPAVTTYAQWRAALLERGSPGIMFDDMLWTGAAFVQLIETFVNPLSPSLFQGRMFRIERLPADRLAYFLDEPL
jgi:hypothetical protein